MTHFQQDLVTQAARRYYALLVEIEEATDKLLLALGTQSIEDVGGLVQARWKLCQEIGKSAQELDSLLLNQNRKSGGSRCPGGDQLHTIMEKIQARQESLLAKQVESESILSAELSKCRSALVDLNQRRDLQAAYGTSSPREDARFLDSKL